MYRSITLPSLAALFLVAACGGESSSTNGPRVDGGTIGVVGAHEHGVARLALVVEGPEIYVTLEAPGDVLFGFERDPETEEEWALVAERVAGLEGGLAGAVEFPADLECRAAGPARISGAPERGEGHDHEDEHDHEEGHDHEDEHDHEEGHDHEDEHDHEDGHDHEDEHSEVLAEVTLVCSASATGRQATLRVGSLLPNLETVDLTVLTETGQAAARVAGDATFSF